MRELNLFETGWLSLLLLLSLVLPMAMSFWGPRSGDARKACMRTVWIGQILGAVAGLALLMVPQSAVYVAVFGLLSCASCAVVLRRQIRGAVTS